jgi:hypothetical protein
MPYLDNRLKGIYRIFILFLVVSIIKYIISSFTHKDEHLEKNVLRLNEK